MTDGSAPSVVVQQPALAAYRVPVFRALSDRLSGKLLVIHSDVPHIDNVSPDGFVSVHSTTIRLLPGLFWDFGQIWAALHARRVVVLSWNTRYLSLVPALVILRIRGVGSVLWGHGFSKQESAPRRWVRDHVTMLSSAVLFYSRDVADRFAHRMKCRAKVFVAPNTLDELPIQAAMGKWSGSPLSLADFLDRKGLLGRPVVLFVSRLVHGNRLDLLVRATVHVAEVLPHVRVVIIGDGPRRDEMESLAKERGLQEVILFPGAIFVESDLAPWFLSASVFCYPGNIGLSLIHSFAYGLPVVTSDDLACHNPEIEALEPGVNGLLYAAGDPEALAAVLIRLLQDDELMSRLSHGALRTFREGFSLAKMVTGMEDAIRFAGTSKEGGQ